MSRASEPALCHEPLDAAYEARLSPLSAANDTRISSLADRLGQAHVSLAAAGAACFWSSDGDLGFHLATGREVLATGRIPTRNVLSFAEPEHVWQLHQWLPGVLFELLYRTFGIGAVISLKMLVVAVTWAVVYRTARRIGASPSSSTLACLLGVAASSVRFEARPYLFTHLTLALILLACAIAAAPRSSVQRQAADSASRTRRLWLRTPLGWLRARRSGQSSPAANSGDERALSRWLRTRRFWLRTPLGWLRSRALSGAADRGEARVRPAELRSQLRSGWGTYAAAGGVAALGCQLHAGALDGFIALAVFATGVAVEPLRARVFGVATFPPAGPRCALRWAVAALSGGLAGAVLLTLYHPLGARILLFPFEMASDTYLAEHLVEFRRPWAFPFASLAAYWLLLMLWAAAAIGRARLVHATWLVLGLVFALLSLRFARMVFAFSIVAAPTLALAFEHTRAAAVLQLRPRVAALLLLALALTLPLYTFRDRSPGFGYEPSVWPLRHFDFIRAHNLQGNAFVSDAWGGPFLGQFYPQRRVFFDNRLEAYSPHFMRDVYQRIRYAQPGWDHLLDVHNIEIVLMRYTTAGESRFQHGAPNLRQQLARDPRFTLIRFDDVGELFVRTHGRNAELARQFALPGIDPDRRRFTAAPSAAAAPLLRAAQKGERSATLLGMAALAIAADGQPELSQGFAREAARLAPEDPWARNLTMQLSAAR